MRRCKDRGCRGVSARGSGGRLIASGGGDEAEDDLLSARKKTRAVCTHACKW